MSDAVAPRPSPSLDAAAPGGPRAAFLAGLAVLVVFYLVVATYRLSDLPLVDPDEPRYAAAGRTMARGGSLLVPQFNGKPRINKPPLFYWLVALSNTIAGEATEASARAPSIAAGLVMLLATVLLGRRVYGSAVSLLAGFILATTPLFIHLSRACITDMTLSAFATITLACLMLVMLGRAPPALATWVAAIALGLALLAKSLPALAVVVVLILDRALALEPARRPRHARHIPWLLAGALLFSAIAVHSEGSVLDRVCNGISYACLLAVLALVFVMAWRAPRGALARMPWCGALLAALAIGSWWYLQLAHEMGWERFRELVLFETRGRLAGIMHREAMYYYAPNLFAVVFPWSVGLIGACAVAWPSGRQDSATPDEAADRFLMAWLLGIVLFFSIPGAKLASYVLPAMPAATLLVARFLLRLCAARDADASFPWRRWRIATLAAAAVCAVGIAAFGFLLPALAQRSEEMAEVLEVTPLLPFPLPAIAVGFALAVLAGWFLAVNARWPRPLLAAFVLGCATLLVPCLAFSAGVRRISETRSTKQFCQAVALQIRDCTHVTTLGGTHVESLAYYLDRDVAEVRRRRVAQGEPLDAVIRAELERPEKTAIFVRKEYYARLLGIKGAELRSMSAADLERSIPRYAKLVGHSADLVLLRN